VAKSSSSKKTGSSKSAPPAKKAAAPAKKSSPAAKKPAPAKPVPAAKKAVASKSAARPAPVAKAAVKPANGAKAVNGAKKPDRGPINNPYAQQPGQFVLSDAKPKKNQAGLGSRDLEHFRELLLAKRRELVGDMSSMEREALRSTSGSNLSNLPIHMADMGTDNYEQEFTLGLVQKDRDILREINLALAKIQNGTYGICEGTGKPIGKPRLEARPWARYSIEYARKLESRGVR
jgi:RNA polymerase-binding protein DksA